MGFFTTPDAECSAFVTKIFASSGVMIPKRTKAPALFLAQTQVISPASQNSLNTSTPIATQFRRAAQTLQPHTPPDVLLPHNTCISGGLPRTPHESTSPRRSKLHRLSSDQTSAPNGIPHAVHEQHNPTPMGLDASRRHVELVLGNRAHFVPPIEPNPARFDKCAPTSNLELDRRSHLLVTSRAMLASKDSTAWTMVRAIAHTSNALDAAITLDLDRSADDRAFFVAEKAIVDALFTKIEAADAALISHELRNERRLQAHVEVGDVVLDRAVRRGKKRVALDVSTAAADQAFGEDITEIVDADRHTEPTLVLVCVDRLAQGAHFAAKADLMQDLKKRAEQQAQNFADRTAAGVAGAALETTLENVIREAADALYTLEKRLLERFPRERIYVRAFFMDVGRRKKPAE